MKPTMQREQITPTPQTETRTELDILLEKDYKPQREPDIYDMAVEWLIQHPDRIYDAWNEVSNAMYNAGHEWRGIPKYVFALFAFCTTDRSMWSVKYARECGCLTQVCSRKLPAETDALTTKIRCEARLPLDGSDIKPEHLPVFAELQRFVDRELNREPVQ